VPLANLEGRSEMTRATWRMFLDHPWLGVGPGAWRWFQPQYRIESLTFSPHYAHNDLFQFAAEYGLAGLALLAATLAVFFRQSLLLTRRGHSDDERALALGSALAVGALLAHSLLDFNMHIPANALLITSLIAMTAGLSGSEGSQRRLLSRRARIVIGAALLFAAAAIAWYGFRLCSAQRCLLAGHAAQSGRQWTEAIHWHRKAIANAPFFAEAHAGIGDAHLFQRDPAAATNAITAFHRSLALNPRDATVELGLALAYETIGNTNQAIAAFARCFALDPHNADHWIEFGRFQQRLGHHTEAMRAYQKAARLNHPAANPLLQRLQHQNR
jgi:tetratricopeptide (TPR) repeat protein